MPQEFQVLRCYKCNFFQVHQVKKGNKWECKMCGEKQSNKKSYGVGSAKECRLHVQKLNTLQAERREQEIDDISKQNLIHLSHSSSSRASSQFRENYSETPPKIDIKNTSKWAKFIEDTGEVDSKTTGSNVSLEEQKMLFGNVEVVLEMPQRKSNTLLKPSKKRERVLEESSNVNIEMELNSKNIPEPISMRWEERSGSSQPFGTGFQNNEVDEERCTKAIKLDSSKPFHIVDGETFTDEMFADDSSKNIVISKKKPLREPEISSNSKWFKFVNENYKDDIQIHNDNECVSADIDYDVNSKHNLEDGEHYFNAPNYSSDNTEKILDSDTESNKNKNMKCKTLFSLVDDENLDSVLDF